jgi:Tfp pilus assembly protein PilV
MKSLQASAGVTFSEVLVAINIAVIAILASSLSSIGMSQRQTNSSNSTVAFQLAQDKLEELQARLNLSETDLCPSGGEHALSAKAGVIGIFDRCWRVAGSALGRNLKQIDVTVAWHDYESRAITVSTLRYIEE